MDTFNIEDLLAMPMLPCIRVQVGPGEVVEIDQQAYEAAKDELVAFCLSLPNLEGASWQILKPYTSNNGLMAKLLIALGDMAGVWTMHPPVSSPDLWSKSSMYPMVLTLQMEPVTPRGVPKPSAGDLEADEVPCECCQRMMGPTDSTIHDLVESMPDLGMCIDCDVAGCDAGWDCQLDQKKEKTEKKKVKKASARSKGKPEDTEPAPEEAMPATWAAYAKQFEG